MEMTTVKTVAVFAIIFGCFAVLYPKIFHPMLLHVLGLNQQTPTAGMGQHEPRAHMPQHLRADIPGKLHPSRDSNPMRGGPHPGMRAAAEMKKQAAGQHGQGGGKGMMGVVLPMYAIGIVLYLVYTMAKVMTRKDASSSSSKEDYLGDHFSDVRRSTGDQHRGPGGDQQRGGREDVDNLTMAQKVVRQQKDLEKLLLCADKENISAGEMGELKRKLLETEAQMTRILKAMEAVQEKVSSVASDTPLQVYNTSSMQQTTGSNKEQSADKSRRYDATQDHLSGYNNVMDDDTDLDDQEDEEEEEEGMYDEYENPCNEELQVTKGYSTKHHVSNTKNKGAMDLRDEEEDDRLADDISGFTDSTGVNFDQSGLIEVSEQQSSEVDKENRTHLREGVEKEQNEERRGNRKKRSKATGNNKKIHDPNEIISGKQRDGGERFSKEEEVESLACSDDMYVAGHCVTEELCGKSNEAVESQASHETTAKKKELRRRVARREM